MAQNNKRTGAGKAPTKSGVSQIVESTKVFEESVKSASKQDYSNVPVKEYAPPQMAKKAKKEAIRIEPKRRIKVKTTKLLDDEGKRYRDHMWEYMEGVFENRAIIGEDITFWVNPFPGDDYAEWRVPCGVVVSAPRWVCKHLSERSYITFKHRPRPAEMQVSDSFLEDFVPDQVIHRSTFVPVGIY